MQGSGSIRLRVMMGAIACLSVPASAFAQPAPSITRITSAAMRPYASPSTFLSPRSIATIYGSSLSSRTESASSPWKSTLAGVEVHVIIDRFTPCESSPPAGMACDITADLIYVSPTQISFVVPDVSPSLYGQSQLYVRVDLVRDGTRFNASCPRCLGGPDQFTISKERGDVFMFPIFDCRYSTSLEHPEACGLSQWSGFGSNLNAPNNRYVTGIMTDQDGNLISAENPVHQGKVITLWVTGLSGLMKSSKTGLVEQTQDVMDQHGVWSRQSKPKAVIAGICRDPYCHVSPYPNVTPVWAGESAGTIGLQQINLVFPTCTGRPKATAEYRMDAYFGFYNSATPPSNSPYTQNFVPLLIRAGDPDCQ